MRILINSINFGRIDTVSINNMRYKTNTVIEFYFIVIDV